MVSAGEQVGTKCSIPFTHITGLWLYESRSWCLEHWTPISFEIQYRHNIYAGRIGRRATARELACVGSGRLCGAKATQCRSGEKIREVIIVPQRCNKTDNMSLTLQ